MSMILDNMSNGARKSRTTLQNKVPSGTVNPIC